MESNKALTFTVTGPGHGGACDRCQARKENGGFMNSLWPTTTWAVTMKHAEVPEPKYLHGLCTDCLCEAREGGVSVLGEDGTPWVVQGVRSRAASVSEQPAKEA